MAGGIRTEGPRKTAGGEPPICPYRNVELHAAARGDSLLMIGKLLGHRNALTTARYAHLAAGPIQQAADGTAGAIAAQMAARPSAEIHPLPTRKHTA